MEEEKTQSGQTSTDEGDVDEMFVSGFCKMQNQSRMVICEVRTEMTGRRRYSPQTAHGVNVSTAGPAC